jgi:hypothetical protein
VADELSPFGVGRGPVFFAGAGGAAAGDKRAVATDGFFFSSLCAIWVWQHLIQMGMLWSFTTWAGKRLAAFQ